jgi:elongation factor Ts
MELQKVKELREKTNVSLNACKKAIEDANGDVDEALVLLQKRGIMKASEKSGRATNEGVVHSYIHSGRIGVLVEINCETDFAAKSDQFKDFCDQVGLQIAGMKPEFVSEIPLTIETKQKEIFKAQIEGKPEKIQEQIIKGKVMKWANEVCLMNQQSVVVEGKTMEELRAGLVATIGENVTVRRFVRWEVGME